MSSFFMLSYLYYKKCLITWNIICYIVLFVKTNQIYEYLIPAFLNVRCKSLYFSPLGRASLRTATFSRNTLMRRKREMATRKDRESAGHTLKSALSRCSYPARINTRRFFFKTTTPVLSKILIICTLEKRIYKYVKLIFSGKTRKKNT